MSPTEPQIIERHEQTSLALLNPQDLIAKAIETGAGIETMERLVALAKEVREVQAKEAWYEAMAEFQRACPPIKKTKRATITGRANYSYTYAPLDEILSTIQPVMGPLGLSVSWRNRVEGDKIIANCRISHTLGHHEESGEIPMPVAIGDDGRGANPMQRIGIATTYAKRYSLLSIIGMAPEDDPDAQGPPPQQRAPQDQPQGNGEGDARTITEPQQKRFYAIARGVKPVAWTDEQIHDLLTARKIENVAAIPMADYDALIDVIKAGPKK